jgi:hypothetical protein
VGPLPAAREHLVYRNLPALLGWASQFRKKVLDDLDLVHLNTRVDTGCFRRRLQVLDLALVLLDLQFCAVDAPIPPPRVFDRLAGPAEVQRTPTWYTQLSVVRE